MPPATRKPRPPNPHDAFFRKAFSAPRRALGLLRIALPPELRAVGTLHYQEIIERPWRIVYRVQGERVLVLAVLDGRRSLTALLLERLVRI